MVMMKYSTMIYWKNLPNRFSQWKYYMRFKVRATVMLPELERLCLFFHKEAK